MIHIAVLIKAYLDLVLSGGKTVECRLTRQSIPPYESIERGERIYFKQSAGPYRATAIAEQVLFAGELTPSRVAQLRRDYNELIRGDAGFWRIKRDSRFASLIWLRDVEPVDNGPAIAPLQGRAWATLPEETAWRRRDVAGGSFHVEITPGNLRHNSLYVTHVREHFPTWSIGGRSKDEAGRPITLVLHEGPTIETDIVGPRNLIRARIWGDWFRRHDAAAGDHVVFTPVDHRTYFVGLARGDGPESRRS